MKLLPPLGSDWVNINKKLIGKTRVSFRSYYDLQQVPEKRRLKMVDAVQFDQFQKEYYIDAGQPVPETPLK